MFDGQSKSPKTYGHMGEYIPYVLVISHLLFNVWWLHPQSTANQPGLNGTSHVTAQVTLNRHTQVNITEENSTKSH